MNKYNRCLVIMAYYTRGLTRARVEMWVIFSKGVALFGAILAISLINEQKWVRGWIPSAHYVFISFWKKKSRTSHHLISFLLLFNLSIFFHFEHKKIIKLIKCFFFQTICFWNFSKSITMAFTTTECWKIMNYSIFLCGPLVTGRLMGNPLEMTSESSEYSWIEGGWLKWIPPMQTK